MEAGLCIALDTLTESGAVFKVAQNTSNKLWRRLSVALGVLFLETLRLRNFLFYTTITYKMRHFLSKYLMHTILRLVSKGLLCF